MPITTTRVCFSMLALDHDWSIVASYPGGAEEQCVSGWHWHMPISEVGAFLVARDDAGEIVTVQKKLGPGQFVLLAKLRGKPAKVAA
jgi:hypothetical protein